MTELFYKHSETIGVVVSSFFPNHADAEDAYQEVHLKLSQLEDRDIWQGLDNEGGLVRTVVTNLCRDLYNKDKRTRELDQQAAIFEDRHDDDPLSNLLKYSFDEEVGRKIDDLPSELALTAKLYYLEGRSYKQISDILDVPEGTVASRLNTARRYFQGEDV